MMDTINVDEIEHYLAGVTYPASKNALAVQAEKNHARKEIISLLHELPDREYRTPTEVNTIINEILHKQFEIGPSVG